MKPRYFFARHPVFRHDEFTAVYERSGERSRQTSASVLKQHVAAGNLVHVRRGLYAVVPVGVSPVLHQPDPYLLATHLVAEGAVTGQAALQFHGLADPEGQRFDYLTRKRAKPFYFRGRIFAPAPVAPPLRELPDLGGGIRRHLSGEGMARIATLERVLVDVLETPGRIGEWEEVWRALAGLEELDLDAVVDFTEKRQSALLAARVGFYLERYRERLLVRGEHLGALQELAPTQVRYLDRRRQPGKLVRRWNLIVPPWMLQE